MMVVVSVVVVPPVVPTIMMPVVVAVVMAVVVIPAVAAAVVPVVIRSVARDVVTVAIRPVAPIRRAVVRLVRGVHGVHRGIRGGDAVIPVVVSRGVVAGIPRVEALVQELAEPSGVGLRRQGQRRPYGGHSENGRAYE